MLAPLTNCPAAQDDGLPLPARPDAPPHPRPRQPTLEIDFLPHQAEAGPYHVDPPQEGPRHVDQP